MPHSPAEARDRQLLPRPRLALAGTDRLSERYGVAYPIANAVGVFAAPTQLAIAVSNAGGLGFIGASPERPRDMRARILEIQAATDRAFGVGFLLAPSRFGDFASDEHVAICARERVPVVSFQWAIPAARWVEQLHAAGSQVWIQASSLELALRAVAVGADALIVRPPNTSQHGSRTPSLETLLRRVRRVVPRETLLVAAGGVSDGTRLAQALRAGADGACLESCFAGSLESYAFAAPQAAPGVAHQPRATREQDWPHYDTSVRKRDGARDPAELNLLSANDGSLTVHSARPAAEIIRQLMNDAIAVLRA